MPNIMIAYTCLELYIIIIITLHIVIQLINNIINVGKYCTKFTVHDCNTGGNCITGQCSPVEYLEKQKNSVQP